MMFEDIGKLEQLSCEIIETFNRFGFYDAYCILLKDKHYDSYKGWSREIIDPNNYITSNEQLWNENFNIIMDGDIQFMFHSDPDIVHDVCDVTDDKTDSRNMIRCYALLRRIFRRYNIEWTFINESFGLTFREVEKC